MGSKRRRVRKCGMMVTEARSAARIGDHGAARGHVAVPTVFIAVSGAADNHREDR